MKKNMLKKGGVADIVTLMIIVGLVIALIIAVVLPMVNSASRAGNSAEGNVQNTNGFIDQVGKGTNKAAPTYTSKTNINQ